MSDERYDDGMDVRREVLGDAHVDRAIANTTEFTQPFQDFITRAAWGEVWAPRRAGPPHAQHDHARRADRAALRRRDRHARARRAAATG